ncbi:cytochrome c oxidase accessory protein CcoG [Azorhizobium oxalatiphilum]|uniref:Cytochrome c oxidase accessory protein CcoG n=1 Tax=Azorhizobium oxalatiphilum TaxID=980631 RepID=A0A917FFU6_9HYPH|nr:cytochrome c oxidase accessory protein CcoG [Azorhizobium oxalatiphilum]GGF81062.1 cytochrome c oxidase accessory protein CcoG [Azorhizobium oxalatiphilum]
MTAPVNPAALKPRLPRKGETVAVAEDELYAARRAIYPQSVRGRLRNIKWVLLLVTLGIYYFLPFVRWDRGPDAPGQAVLIDFPARRFYFFFIEIWPQEFYYLAGLLILASLVLFLMNAVAGRVWCGYLCPQTVWTDLFLKIERMVEGDRREHMMSDAGPWTMEKVAKKTLKHAIWLLIAWWTGGAWVLYFADAPTLVKELATFQGSTVAYGSIAVLTFTTYTLAGHMREQVCTYMCPWPRIQAALTDEYALNVTYLYDRGEPRGSVKKAALARAAGQPAGDCIDCNLCVNTCPTGVDIRKGMQLDCIQCGLCIDACNNVMDKINRPRGLITYESEANMEARAAGKQPVRRIVRARTVLYTALILLVGGIMIGTLAGRSTEGLSAIHDRNPVYVRLSDGTLRNAYTLRLINKKLEPRRFVLTVDGLPNTRLSVVGTEPGPEGEVLAVGPDQTLEARVFLTHAGKLPPGASVPVTFRIRDLADGTTASVTDNFIGP